MEYKDFVTAGELRKFLLKLPHNTIIDIARDPELNGCGPIAMLEDGEASVAVERLKENGRQVVVLWPLESDDWNSRYVDETEDMTQDELEAAIALDQAKTMDQN